MIQTDSKSLNEQILALREKTGAGMMDCKKALTEAQGDFNKAIESLRKKGLADAAKRSARVTKEGLVAAAVTADGKRSALVELGCETDFVAKTENFQKLAATLAAQAADKTLASPQAASGAIQPVIAKVGENITLRRFERYELKGPGLLAYYIHTSGSKKGAMIEIAASSDAVAKSEASAELAKELLLQIVAMGPRWIRREEVPAADIEKEKEIYAAQLKNEGKPEAAIPKIVEGKVNKLFFQSFCLLEMVSMRDNKTPVSKIVSDASAKAGGSLTVSRFIRYQLGE